MHKGIVNKIIPSSLVDGPGNRCAIFFQGCNFNCMYCHNPETINFCNNCGICVEKCPAKALSFIENKKVFWDKKNCVDCDTCLKVCPHGASPKVTLYTPLELKDKVALCMPFITGVTTSGGECTIQYEFLSEFFKEVKALGLSTLSDTNGYIPFDTEKMEKFLQYTDGFMLDIKAFDEGEHKKLTGKSNANVIENALYLAGIGKLDEIRTVLYQGADNFNTVDSITKLLSKYTDKKKIRYKLISYRPFGVRDEYLNLKTVSEIEKKELQKVAEKNGNYEVILI